MNKFRSEKEKRLFNMKEAALYLGRSEWGVRRLIWSGDLPYIRQGRRVHLTSEIWRGSLTETEWPPSPLTSVSI